MRHRNRRLGVIALAGTVLVASVVLGLMAIRDAVIFFYSPTEIVAEGPEPGQRIRVGGLVGEGSVSHVAEAQVRFDITDGAETVRVRYEGTLPDLFREGQGVIAEGAMRADGEFEAAKILAKHDEAYMPPEVAEALREAGTWQGDEEAAPDSY